jgi:hypothetical protein
METQTFNVLFSPGGCLNAQAFRRYLDSSLRPAEKLKVEDHLKHCLICSEALEGFKRHRSNEFMQSDLEFLSGKIRKRYASHHMTQRFLPVIILISLLVFLLILLVIYYIIRYMLMNQ